MKETERVLDDVMHARGEEDGETEGRDDERRQDSDRGGVDAAAVVEERRDPGRDAGHAEGHRAQGRPGSRARMTDQELGDQGAVTDRLRGAFVRRHLVGEGEATLDVATDER